MGSFLDFTQARRPSAFGNPDLAEHAPGLTNGPGSTRLRISMNRKALLPIALIVVVDVLGYTMIFPLLPFFAQRLGATATQIGLLISSFAFCQLISGPFLGSLSDRWGRKPVLIASQIGTFLGFILLANSRYLWVAFLARMLDGATAGNLTVAQAYIADVTEKKDRARAFAIIGIAFGFGFLVGPAISGFLSHWGYAVPIYGSAAASLLSILGTIFLLPKTTPVKTAEIGAKVSVFQWKVYRELIGRPNLTPFLIQFFCFFVSFSLFFSGFPLFAEQRLGYGPREVGFVFAYTGLLGMIIQGGLLGKWVKRWGELPLVQYGLYSMVIGYFILATSFHLSTLLVSATVSAFGTAVLRPSLTALISKQTPPEHQGLTLGLTQSMNSVAQILAPILAGLMIEHAPLSAWAVVSGLVVAVALAFSPSAKRALARIESAGESH